jgi:hypothetical protein
LGRGSGQTTIRARVQNQLYQQTDQASLATGANIVNASQRSLAQVSNQNIDLSLLQTQQTDEPLTLRWLAACRRGNDCMASPIEISSYVNKNYS